MFCMLRISVSVWVELGRTAARHPVAPLPVTGDNTVGPLYPRVQNPRRLSTVDFISVSGGPPEDLLDLTACRLYMSQSISGCNQKASGPRPEGPIGTHPWIPLFLCFVIRGNGYQAPTYIELVGPVNWLCIKQLRVFSSV